MKVKMNFRSTCINLNNVYKKFNELCCNVILQIHKQTSIRSFIYTVYTNNKQYGNVLRC